MIRNLFSLILVSPLLMGCEPSVQTVNYETDGSSGATCELDFFSEGLTISERYKVVGEVSVRDTGFSINCGKEVVMSKIKNAACSARADAIQMFDVQQPSIRSTCFQASARLIKY